MSDQPVAEAAIYTTNTRDEHPFLHRDSNPQYQKTSGYWPTLRRHGHQDRQI